MASHTWSFLPSVLCLPTPAGRGLRVPTRPVLCQNPGCQQGKLSGPPSRSVQPGIWEMRGLEHRQGLSPPRGHRLAPCPPLQPGDVAPLPPEQQNGTGQGLLSS